MVGFKPAEFWVAKDGALTGPIHSPTNAPDGWHLFTSQEKAEEFLRTKGS